VKAVRFHEHGSPDVLRYEEAPDPDEGELYRDVYAGS